MKQTEEQAIPKVLPGAIAFIRPRTSEGGEMTLYETDYEHWLSEQITNLQHQKWDSLDIPHLIEELEALNRSNKRELYSYTVLLLAHLLKWQYQPSMRSGSWEASIDNSRKRIGRVFKDQPSLKNYLKESVQETYAEAKEWAHKETKLNINLFPQNCPYSVQEILSLEFLPD